MQIQWYQKKEFWAIVIFISKGINSLVEPSSFLYLLSDYLLQVGIPLLLTTYGIIDGINHNSLIFPLNKIFKQGDKKCHTQQPD